MKTTNWNLSPFADYDTAPAAADITSTENGISYTLRARKYSHWYLDETDDIVHIAPNKVATEDRWYAFDRRFSSDDTAFVIMDPWADMPCDFMNNYVRDHVDATIVPMAQAAAATGHTVIVLTDYPSKPYNSKIAPKLQEMADNGQLEIVYHEHYDEDAFAAYLESKGIKNLIYSGYFSNMCVLVRPLGIVQMAARNNFIVYFIPQASVAIEHSTTWESHILHHASTIIISQTQAKLLELDDILNVLKQR